MRLSMNWLNDFVKVDDIDLKQYCDVITVTGSKVEFYEKLGQEFQNVVVGYIKEVTKHPNADKLQICTVDVGYTRDVQIVTAATNVFVGAYVPVAFSPEDKKQVATLHNGIEIKTGKLRGELSEGMFCSIAELGLDLHDMPGAVEDGILILNDVGIEAKPGDDIVTVLMLQDNAVEFEITPNRPDCLSVIGLARETAASFDRKLTINKPVVKCLGGDDINNYIDVSIDTPKCYRYTARFVKNVKIEPSPLWMRVRLRASGIRPINNIVDITNYVMVEYGQPMHAFDYRCLSGNQIKVRMANEGEKFITLDNEERTLYSDTMVIADGEKAVGIAGVMGGANSEITNETANVVFESACFDGPCVRTATKKVGMRTESSSRFEKGLDSEMCKDALDRACELVELLGAGEVVNGVIDIYPNKKPTYTVPFEPEKVNRFLGINLSEKEQKAILNKLCFEIKKDKIIVPSYRDDVRCMNDVAEEIVRMYGYDKLEPSYMVAELVPGGLTEKQKFQETVCETLIGVGLDELCTYSFMNANEYIMSGFDKDDEQIKSIQIANPFGEDSKTMRASTIPTTMEVLSLNYKRSVEDCGVFELARIFIPRENVVTNIHNLEGTLPDEKVKISIGMFARGGFKTLKGIIEVLLKKVGIKNVKYIANDKFSPMHPGRCCDVYIKDVKLGTFGEIHPKVAENYGFNSQTRVYIAELDLDTLFNNATKTEEYTPLPKYPSVTRDFSFICDEEVEVATIDECIRSASSKLIENVKVFDIYRGKNLPYNKKSVSFNVVLRSNESTLTVEEADKVAQKILTTVEQKLGITIRK